MKQEERIEQAQGLGWQVGWRTALTAGLYYPGLNYDWIEITTDGEWCHVRKLIDGGEKTMWDSGWTRVRPQQFKPYLKRLIEAAVICLTPKPVPPRTQQLL